MCVVISKENPWMWKTVDCAEDHLRFICQKHDVVVPSSSQYISSSSRIIIHSICHFVIACVRKQRILSRIYFFPTFANCSWSEYIAELQMCRSNEQNDSSFVSLRSTCKPFQAILRLPRSCKSASFPAATAPRSTISCTNIP